MTIRTWVNVVTINRYLEEIRKTDSILLNEDSKSLEKPFLMLNDLQDEIDSLNKHNQELQNKVNAEKKQTTFEYSTFLFTIVVASIFVVLFALLFIGYSRAKKKSAEREDESRNYLTKLNEANEEIEKMLNTENDLAHKLNILQTDQETNLAKIIQEKSEIEDEKILLENQILEIKKAYVFEVTKRMEKESELVSCKQQIQLMDDSKGEKQKITDLEGKVSLLAIEKEQLEKTLVNTQTVLETEIKSRENAEASLEILMLQLKNGGFLQEGSQELIHLPDELIYRKQYVNENIALTEELKNLRFKYNQELKMKMQMKEDLDQIISKIKSTTFE
jgi:DNA repair exonuclease SbcCD ATPase subunit